MIWILTFCKQSSRRLTQESRDTEIYHIDINDTTT
jgi:hypothetical protein